MTPEEAHKILLESAVDEWRNTGALWMILIFCAVTAVLFLLFAS